MNKKEILFMAVIIKTNGFFWNYFTVHHSVNMVERENNYSGVHLDNCLAFLNRKG